MSDSSLGHTDTEIDPAAANDGTEPFDAALTQAPLEDPQTPSDDNSPQGMIPARSRRRTKVERASMRVLATGGIIGIATALGAALVGNDVAGWIVGLVIGLTSVVLAAVLWSSRQL